MLLLYIQYPNIALSKNIITDIHRRTLSTQQCSMSI